MNYLFENYPVHLSLDVSTDNATAIRFYLRIGLEISRKYLTEDGIEFSNFVTPQDFAIK